MWAWAVLTGLRGFPAEETALKTEVREGGSG